MAQLWTFFLVCAILVLACHHVSSTVTFHPKLDNVTDRHALLSFKSMLSDDSRRSLASWNDSIHFCSWPGIACGGQRHPQRVVSLVLSSLGLAGSISPAITNLTLLRTIDLSNNQLHGPVPDEIGNLFRLQHLNLSMNSLGGGIPETLSNCSRLQELSLHRNLLTGKILSGIGGCLDLRLLTLSNNNLTGNIPPALTNLSSLVIISLSSNQLSGSIPPTIGNLYSLAALSIASTKLSGSIPPSIGNLSKLSALGLMGNQLTGAIPYSLWNLSSLSRIHLGTNKLSGSLPWNTGQALPLIEEIDLFENQIHGPIPISLSNASRLVRIDFSFNNFTGTIPSNLGNLQNLEWINLGNNMLEAKEPDGWNFLDSLTNCTELHILELDSNKLGGMLPHSIANLSTKLQILTMGDNRIFGNISPEIGNLVSLTNFDLGPNLLTGSIPASIGMFQNLVELDLDDNKLSGEIPSSIGNLTQLIALFLDYNELSGSIPASLGNCRNLNLLNLQSNRLTGGIPKEILTMPALSIGLVLSFNSLTGPIPTEVGNLKNLGKIDFSMNNLSGEIPSSLGGCLELEMLFFRGNLFHGSIPSSLSALRGTEYFDLSNNNLSGPIPDFLQDFRFLLYLNLSFNNFEGAVPRRGVFANTSAAYVLGNHKLCGGIPELHLPDCPSISSNNKHRNSHGLILIISVATASSVLLILFCFLVACCWMQKSRRKDPGSASTGEQERVSYAELQRATDGFSTENLIGAGSFARVYKATMRDADDDSTKFVAVKVLNLQMQGASKSFMAECETLRNIRHRNLVKILTACSSVDSRGNEFKAVVLEFMANGSLDDWLHPRENEQLERKKLNLMERLNIAIDVASALDYLHHYGEIPIVHCDLKPSNVLLDNDMTAHVSDFGLARFLRNVVSKSSQHPTSSIGLKGTIGYVPPEYGVANRVSTRGDVYSYGILLLEMFTARSPTDGVFMEGLSLRRFVERAIPERVIDVIDAQLLSLEDSQNTNSELAVECIASVLRVGILCSNEQPEERLEMGAAINELHKIRNVFVKETRAAWVKVEGSS